MTTSSTSTRGLRTFVVIAMVLIELGTLYGHWGDVTQKKPDFAALYNTAAMIRAGKSPDYSPATIKGIDVAYNSAAADSTPTVKTDSLHPPFEYLLFLPFTFLSYRAAYLVWYACNLILLWCTPLVLWPFIRNLHRDFHFIAILFGSMLQVVVCLTFGQDSILLLVLLTASYISLERRREWWAGVFLGLGLFKFQLILPIVAVFLIARAWKLIAGFVAALALLMCGSFAVVGIRTTFAYVPFVLAFGKHISRNPGERTALMPNLRGLVSLATDSAGLLAVMIILAVSAITFIAVLRWNVTSKLAPPSVRFAVLVTMSSLVSYHYYVYNATVLILPILLFANELASSRVNSRFKIAFAIAAISMYIVPVLFSLQIGMPVMASASIALLILLLAYPGRTPEVLDLSESSSAVTGSAF
jgi:hypothetical protein